MGKILAFTFAVLCCVLIQESFSQEERPPQQEYEHHQFFYNWKNNNNPYVELNDKQAAWWYSLGEYRPRNNYRDTYYPPPAYDYPVPYEYPPYYGGGSGSGGDRCQFIPGPMRKRMEIREMTPAMRTNFVNAVTALSNYCPDGCIPCNSPLCTSAYDLFVVLHQPANSPEAHGGASFLTFHREYLWRFEIALTLIGGYPPDQGLPYWDSILDSSLPDPTDSVLWTSSFMGNENGLLLAPFAGLSVPSICGDQVYRAAPNSNPSSYLFQESDVEVLMDQTCFAHLTWSTAWTCPWGPCNFENRHGNTHTWVGGDMGGHCSPSDPLFWLHHGFVDCLWEDHRNNAQTTDLETEYPQSHTGGPMMEWNAKMWPFPGLINAHGLSTHYTKYYYECNPRPSGKNCDVVNCNPLGNTNPALWCDEGKCRSKIRVGGKCDNLPNIACWCANGSSTPRCEDGYCKCYLTIAADLLPAVLAPMGGK